MEGLGFSSFKGSFEGAIMVLYGFLSGCMYHVRAGLF